MRRYKAPLLAAFIAILCTGAARADAEIAMAAPRDPEQAREMIEHLYRLEQAFITCDNVQVSGADLIRLDDAIVEFEQTSGVAAADLESIYDQVETLAVGNPADFCAGIGDPSASIKTIAAEQR